MGCDLLGFIFFVLPPPSLVLRNVLYCVSIYRYIPFFVLTCPFRIHYMMHLSNTKVNHL